MAMSHKGAVDRIRKMFSSLTIPDYSERHPELLPARDKLSEDGIDAGQIEDILADALEQSNANVAEFRNICKDISQQGKNHPLAKNRLR